MFLNDVKRLDEKKMYEIIQMVTTGETILTKIKNLKRPLLVKSSKVKENQIKKILKHQV